MPTRFRKLDVDDPIVAATLATSTKGQVWSDSKLLSELKRQSVKGTDTLTLDELNAKLGPKSKHAEYCDTKLGLYRRHYRIIDGRVRLRCCYYLPGAQARSKQVDIRSIRFPDQCNELEFAIGCGSNPRAAQNKAKSKKPNVKPRPQAKHGKTMHPAQVQHQVAAQAASEAAAVGGKRSRESTGRTPIDRKKQGIDDEREKHEHDIAALLLGEAPTETVAGLKAENENLRGVNKRLSDSYFSADSTVDKLKADCLTKDAEITRLTTELAAVRGELAELQDLTAEHKEVDPTEIKGNAKTLLGHIRGIRNLNDRDKVLTKVGRELHPRELGSLLAGAPALDEDAVVLQRLKTEWGAFVQKCGMTTDEAIKHIFDENGRVREDFSLDKMERDLTKPLDASAGQSRSLLVQVFETLLISDKSDDQLRRAKMKAAQQQDFRPNYDKWREGRRPGYVDQKSGTVYARPPLSGTRSSITGRSELYEWIAKKEKSRTSRIVQFESQALRAVTGANLTTPFFLLLSLGLSFCGNMSRTALAFATKAHMAMSRPTINRLLRKVGSRYRHGLPTVLKRDVDAGAVIMLLFITDNYVFLQWAVLLMIQKSFTQSAYTMSLLTFKIRQPTNLDIRLNDDPNRPAASPPGLCVNRILTWLWTNRQAILDLKPELTTEFTRELFPQAEPSGDASLTHFDINASIAGAKSSKVTDAKDKVLPELESIAQGAGLGDKDTFLLLDGEIVLVFMKLAKFHYDSVKDIAILLAVFHLQMHLIVASLTIDIWFWKGLIADLMRVRQNYFEQMEKKHTRRKGEKPTRSTYAADAAAAAPEEEEEEDDDKDDDDAESNDSLEFENDDDDEALQHHDRSLAAFENAEAEDEGAEDEDDDDEDELDLEDRIERNVLRSAVTGDDPACVNETGNVEGDLTDAEAAVVAGVETGDDEGAQTDAQTDAKAAAAESWFDLEPPDDPELLSWYNKKEGLPGLGGVAKKDELKLKYARLLHMASVAREASKNIHDAARDLVTKTYREAQTDEGTDDVDFSVALKWLCRRSNRFEALWVFLFVKLPMMMDPFAAWEDGDSLPIHQHLGIFTAMLTYATNDKMANSAKVVPWLLVYLSATLYRAENRPDLVQIAALNCKHVYDVFIEHLNSLFKRSLANNIQVTPSAIKEASSRVRPRWETKHLLARELGIYRKPYKPELRCDRDRVRTASFKATLEAAEEYLLRRLEEAAADVSNDDEFITIQDEVDVGFQRLPGFIRMFKRRLDKATWPASDEEIAQAKSTATEKVAAAKESLTTFYKSLPPAQLLKRTRTQLLADLTEVKYKGRHALKKTQMLQAVCTLFGIPDPSASPPPAGASAATASASAATAGASSAATAMELDN